MKVSIITVSIVATLIMATMAYIMKANGVDPFTNELICMGFMFTVFCSLFCIPRKYIDLDCSVLNESSPAVSDNNVTDSVTYVDNSSAIMSVIKSLNTQAAEQKKQFIDGIYQRHCIGLDPNTITDDELSTLSKNLLNEFSIFAYFHNNRNYWVNSIVLTVNDSKWNLEFYTSCIDPEMDHMETVTLKTLPDCLHYITCFLVSKRAYDATKNEKTILFSYNKDDIRNSLKNQLDIEVEHL